MRPILIGDILACARLLQAFPQNMRRAHCQQWLHEAHCADKYRKRLGRCHPQWGNGSLMGRASAHSFAALGETPLQNPDFRACLALVLTELNTRSQGQIPSKTRASPPHMRKCDTEFAQNLLHFDV